MRRSITHQRRWPLVTTLAAALLVPLASAPGSALAAPGDAPAGPRAVAADGTVQALDAINPSSRTAGMFALYTPEFGPSTKTNQFGGEAVLQETATAGTYKVLDVCTVFTNCANKGDNAIPRDGAVLSASPGGTPDVRTFLRDHIHVGELVTLDDLTVRSVSTTIDATDPTAASHPGGVDPASGNCYPGCRGAEQLIVYTAASGRPTTKTNDYGYEVTVVDGRVVTRGGNNREIPADGMVISGHGGRGAWLSSNAVPGAKVAIEGSTLTVTIDESTYMYGAEQALTRAGDSLTAAGQSCLTIDNEGSAAAAAEARSLLDQAAAASEAGDVDAAVALAERAREQAELAWYRTAESRPVEGRGMWVRPTETTPAQIAKTLDQIGAAGVNMVFLETVFQGYTIYPSAVAKDNGITAQRPEMAGFDPLQVWIDEAHARDIELHPWVHTFFVGAQSVNENGGAGPILEAHPEWAAVEREDVGKAGPQPSSQEEGYFFVDPAMPEPRAYMLSIYEEILTKYDVEGLHLDYIRYPVSQPWQTASFSYSDFSRDAFAAEFGKDPYTLTPADPLWKSWDAWREGNVTSFVSEVRELQQKLAPETQLSAAVFPDPADGLAKKFQNWADWVDKGYVDVLTGMSFGTSAASVARDTELMRKSVGDENLLYTATYGPFRGSSPDVLVDQTQAVRDAHSDGAALFAYNQLSAPQATALEEGVFRVEATTPHSDLIAASREAGRWTAENVEKATGACIPEKTATKVQRELDRADRFLEKGKPAEAVKVYAKTASLISGSAEVQPEFAARMLRDLAMYQRWSGQAAAK
ncbi:glycoside hydrolase family 10 protein [Arthrobacter zhaoguopingii]|uniref:glycoside hydrolase family 10 protein n=1 Tax=Arthrobacter zhaoguopingii TaxID=2681491 RepID=UPI001358895D|nr:family 10 glycosylhydrolase [Arthrobacter zhaoguopingii]